MAAALFHLAQDSLAQKSYGKINLFLAQVHEPDHSICVEDSVGRAKSGGKL
jgi:hypothetical protein